MNLHIAYSFRCGCKFKTVKTSNLYNLTFEENVNKGCLKHSNKQPLCSFLVRKVVKWTNLLDLVHSSCYMKEMYDLMYQKRGNTCQWSPVWLRADVITHKVIQVLRPVAWSSAMIGVFRKSQYLITKRQMCVGLRGHQSTRKKSRSLVHAHSPNPSKFNMPDQNTLNKTEISTEAFDTFLINTQGIVCYIQLSHKTVCCEGA